nr:ubiquitin-conjugating enzyme E2 8 [Aspergillus niger CBS 513.88]|eukprot:XP_003188821.1 ubiquitin-conjugating enzyme E2 8 [Aspergillus niger CBS 513.88]
MSSPKRRIETDVMKMLMSDYEVTLVNDNSKSSTCVLRDLKRHPLPVATGRSTSNYPTSTHTRARVSDL